jgi:hypothetical protein
VTYDETFRKVARRRREGLIRDTELCQQSSRAGESREPARRRGSPILRSAAGLDQQ